MSVVFSTILYFPRAYGSAHQDDLFEYLTTQAHADGTLPREMTVKQIMDDWTLHPGFPLVRVSKSDSRTIEFNQVNNLVKENSHNMHEHFQLFFRRGL
jgi:hypothetical protein